MAMGGSEVKIYNSSLITIIVCHQIMLRPVNPYQFGFIGTFDLLQYCTLK